MAEFPDFSPSPAGFDEPLEILRACHERVRRMVEMLIMLREHLREHGADQRAIVSAGTIRQYFQEAWPRHLQDEELDLLPRLQARLRNRATAAAANIAPDSDGYVWIAQDKFHESFCQDLPADEALVMAVTQKAPVGSTFGDTVTDPAWKKKPTWYQISTEDRMIHPDNERRMAKRMNPRGTIALAASHASLASQATAVCDLIEEAANSLA